MQRLRKLKDYLRAHGDASLRPELDTVVGRPAGGVARPARQADKAGVARPHALSTCLACLGYMQERRSLRGYLLGSIPVEAGGLSCRGSPDPPACPAPRLPADLLMKMLVFEPEGRCSADEALQHPFLNRTPAAAT